MRRKIFFLAVTCFCCALAFQVGAQQKKRPQRGAKQPQSASSLDGNWTGKTEQDLAITFTVLKGRITEFSVGGRFQGYGCSSTSTTNTTVNQRIVNKSFSFSSPGGPGGIALHINGTFTTKGSRRGIIQDGRVVGWTPTSFSTTAEGVASMALNLTPSAPGCGGSLRTTWIAAKGDQPPSGEVPALAKEPTSKRARPPLLELISPKEGDVLDNGCDDFKEPIIWEFRWSEVRGAQRYHLYVIHEFAENPVIDDSNIKSNSYTSESKGFILSQSLTGWKWKVRPMINGVWKDWSDKQTFSVEPANMDCRD